MKENTTVVLSAEDSELDAFCLAHGTRLCLLKDTLDGMADNTPGKREIERRLRRMQKSYSARNLDAAEGWLYATIDGIKAIGTWLPKTKGKLASENALVENQPKSALALREKRASKFEKLRQNVDAYFARHPKALDHGATACRNALKARNELVYSPSYALTLIGEIFRDRRGQKG